MVAYPGAAEPAGESRTIDNLGHMRIPAMPITNSELMAITIPKDADHRRSEATLGCSYHAEVIGIRQSFCALSQGVGCGARGRRLSPLAPLSTGETSGRRVVHDASPLVLPRRFFRMDSPLQLDPVSVVHEPVKDAVGDGGIADLRVPGLATGSWLVSSVDRV